jgi:hypothetical protein
MQLIRNVGEVTPWADRLAQVPPETVATAVGALLEVSGSRERAYRLAYTLFDARLIPRQTQIGNAGMTLAEWDEWSNEVATLLPAYMDGDAAQEELIRRWVAVVALVHEHTADLNPDALAARDAARGELLREWARDGYELPTDVLLSAPEPDRWVPDDDGCTHPQWDMPTDTVTARTGGISTDVFGYREDLDEVERQAHAMLAAVGYARRFAAEAVETIKLSDCSRPSDGEHEDNLLTQERADQVRADVANNRSSSDGYSDGHSR